MPESTYHLCKSNMLTDEQLNEIFNNSPIGIFISNPEGRYISVNSSQAKMFGYDSPEELIESITDISDQVYSDSAERQKFVYFMEEHGEVLDYECRFLRRDGKEFWVSVNARAIKNDDGLIVSYYGWNTDITDRKKAEETLRSSREQLSTLLSNLPGMAYRCENNKDWNMHFVSDGSLALNGYTAEELTGDQAICYEQIIHPDDRNYVRVKVEEALQKGEHFEIEYRIIAKDSSEKWVWERGEAVPYDNGTQIFIEGFISDITERKRMEKDLREEREHINQILRATKTNMNTLDSDYNLLKVDSVWRKIYGDPRGRKCYEYFMGSDKPCSGCGVPEAFESSKIIVTEEFLPEENRYVEVHTIPFQDENGEWLVTEFNIDITERKREEAEKEKLQLQLTQSQKMESIGRLAGGVAHDFNNMLCVILGHTELAMDKIEPDAPLFADLEEVLKAAERSAELTRQLLTFARKQTVVPKVIDLNDTVGGMLKMLSRLIGEDIDLVWMPGKNLMPIKIDPSQIDQILVNLCVNARDAIILKSNSLGMSLQPTDYVGKMTIETDVVSFDQAYCKDHAEFLPGEYILLAVSDNGCGMDSETLNYLFEPFFTTKDLGKGVGLGLPSVYGAVKQNNGFIKVYSEPMQGTTFKIYLPQNHTDKAIHTDKEEAKQTVSGSGTILLVEDEPDILRMVKIMLERIGYVVIPALTPGEAIHQAYEHNGEIDLLMTDVVMPEMNGRDLAKNLLSIYPDIKRLFMSGYTANVIAHHGVLDQGVSFIQKPFSSKDLATKVYEVLEHKDD